MHCPPAYTLELDSYWLAANRCRREHEHIGNALLHACGTQSPAYCGVALALIRDVTPNDPSGVQA